MKASLGWRAGWCAFFLLAVAQQGLSEPIQNFRRSAFIGGGYKSKAICSGMMVEGKPSSLIIQEDLAPADPRLSRVHVSWDSVGRWFTGQVTLPRPIVRHVHHIDDSLGCVVTDTVIPQYKVTFKKPDTPNDNVDWRNADSMDLDWAFDQKMISQGAVTESMIAIQGGRLIAEKYRKESSPLMRHQGWSLSKSITTALVGRAVQLGKLHSTGLPVLAPEWKVGDPRREITWQNLLQMSSGLEFKEDYGSAFSDVSYMLFSGIDMGNYTASKPLLHRPGSFFSYSSGTSNITARALRGLFSTHQEYLNFPHEELFAKIGMGRAVFELDKTGTYVGASGMYAATRDWARFGQLYLQNGVWKGEQILPVDWAKWSCQPVAVAPKGEYGGGFWTNGFANTPQAKRPWPSLPADACSGIGYLGQMVLMIPSQDLVIVRMGSDRSEGAWTPETVGKALRLAH